MLIDWLGSRPPLIRPLVPQLNIHDATCFRVGNWDGLSDALASLALIIVTHRLKIEIGHSSFLTAMSSSVNIYLSQIAKCIYHLLQNMFASLYLSLLQNAFVSNCKMYLSQIANVFVSNWKMYSSPITKCIHSNCKMHLSQIKNIYLSQIAKCICLKLQNIFVSNCKMCLSQIAKCVCFKLQNVFVSNYKCICFKLQN